MILDEETVEKIVSGLDEIIGIAFDHTNNGKDKYCLGREVTISGTWKEYVELKDFLLHLIKTVEMGYSSIKVSWKFKEKVKEFVRENRHLLLNQLTSELEKILFTVLTNKYQLSIEDEERKIWREKSSQCCIVPLNIPYPPQLGYATVLMISALKMGAIGIEYNHPVITSTIGNGKIMFHSPSEMFKIYFKKEDSDQCEGFSKLWREISEKLPEGLQSKIPINYYPIKA